MATLSDYLDKWRELVTRVERHGREEATPNELIWFDLQILIQAINNGGLISYYYNSGADDLPTCLASLYKLELNECASLLLKVNKLFPHGVPKAVEGRNKVIKSWPDDNSIDQYLDSIEMQASVEVTTVEKRLLSFLQINELH